MPCSRLCQLFVRTLFLGVTVIAIGWSPLVAPIFGQAESQPGVADDAQSDLAFRNYAQWAIESFDSDGDGSLTKDEMATMPGPLINDWYDSNRDGKLSFEEIVEAIKRPSSAKVKDEPSSQPGAARLDLKAIQYASAVIRQYDMDLDNYLSVEESKEMRRPIPRLVDRDKDDKYSLHEIATFLSNSNSENENVKPVVVVKEDLNLSSDNVVQRFLESSLKTNDTNNDGKLDANEIANARWSTIQWQDSDTNNDGELSIDELKNRYEIMIAKLSGQQQASNAKQQESEEFDPSRAEAMREMMQQMSRQARDSGKQPKSGGGLMGNLPLALPRQPGAPKESKSTNKSPAFVDVEVYLIRLPTNSSPERLDSAVKSLGDSIERTSEAVKRLTQRLGISSYDQMLFSAMNQRRTELHAKASVPMVVGSTSTVRGGRSQNKQMLDVGLVIEVTPEVQDDGIILQLSISKSDLLTTENEESDIPDNVILQWTFDSPIQIKNGKPAVIGSSNAQQRWILVVDADLVE